MSRISNRLPRNITLMYVYAFINRFVFAFPIKTLFFVEVTGSFMLAMSIFAVQEWSGVLFEIPTGCLSDRWGRRKVAIIGAAARLSCFALYAFAPGYAMLFAGAVCYGLSEALASGNNEAAFDFNSVFVKQFVPVWSLGTFRAAGHIFSSFGMFVSTAVVRRLGAAPTLLAGFLADNLINLFSILIANIWTPFIRTLAPLAEGPAVPLLSEKIQNELPSDIRATVPSVINLGESVIYGTFALTVGFLADSLSPYWALIITYSVCTVSNIFFMNAFRAEKESQPYPGSQLQVS